MCRLKIVNMLEEKSVETLKVLIKKDFSFEEMPIGTLEEIRKWLYKHIEYMLRFEFEKLMQAFYRIDLEEKKVSDILAFQGDDVALELTNAIIDRMIQKVKLREMYS